MRVLRFIGSVFFILSISAICILAASVFNPALLEKVQKASQGAIWAIKEFSEKAQVNAFTEGRG